MNIRFLSPKIIALVSVLMAVGAVGLLAHHTAPLSAAGQRFMHDGQSYVSTWAASAQPMADTGISHDGFNQQTVRQIIHTHADGQAVRIVLSNTYGTTPLKVGAATIAPSTGGATIASHGIKRLTFNGHSDAMVAPGARLLSDPVAMSVHDDTNLAVDLYFPAATGAITWHALSRQDTYLTAAGGGDKTGQSSAAFPVTTQGFFALDEVEVVQPHSPGTVVMVGDSLTDGEASTINANRRLSDDVSRRFEAARAKHVIAAAISGNMLLQDQTFPPDSQSVLARMDRDVLARPAVTDIIFLAGINDIGGAKNFDSSAIIDGMEQMVARAHEHGIRVVGGTLLPFEGAVPGFEYYTPQGEQTRQRVNAAIRSGEIFDGVIDFDNVMKDPTHPTRLKQEFDSGDHLHPNDAGYQAMANTIDIRQFR